jgi:hypothetical protein
MFIRCGLLIFLCVLVPRAWATEPLESLSWLSGQWLGGEGGKRSEEHYMRPAGGVMMGMSRTLRPGRTPEAEFIRIEADSDGGIAYHAFPKGQAPTRFPLVENGPNFAVFANPEHDFPQKITYRRQGEILTATIEGSGKDGAVRHLSWSWRFVGEAP